ncbi:MAG: hypothetical protein WDN03_14370 [Rhizomicrobium sp.]
MPFDRSANRGIKTIGVIQPGIEPTPRIVLASDIGQSFGLIGALVDASMQANRDGKFGAMLQSAHVEPPAEFLAALKASLAAQGYQTVDIAVAHGSSSLLKSYAAIATVPSDAYLDIAVVNYGYLAAGIGDSTPYRPFTGMRCRLVRSSDGKVLMEDVIAYNPIGTPANTVTIAPDPQYTFVDFDALMADRGRAVDGMNKALTDSAAAVGRLLQ